MIHDHFCRCRACKPPLPIEPLWGKGCGTLSAAMAVCLVIWIASGVALAVLS